MDLSEWKTVTGPANLSNNSLKIIKWLEISKIRLMFFITWTAQHLRGAELWRAKCQRNIQQIVSEREKTHREREKSQRTLNWHYNWHQQNEQSGWPFWKIGPSGNGNMKKVACVHTMRCMLWFGELLCRFLGDVGEVGLGVEWYRWKDTQVVSATIIPPSTHVLNGNGKCHGDKS